MSSQDTAGDRTARPRWFGALVMLAALVLIGVLAWGLRILFSQEDPETPAAPPASQQPATAGPTPATTEPQTGTDEPAEDGEDLAWDCQQDLSDNNESVSESAPTVEEWVSAGYNVVPFSEFGGCQKQDSGLRVGYAHTEAGALMAAATYSMALDPSVSEEAADNVEVAIAEGPNRDLLAEKAERIRDGLEEGTDGTLSASATLTGYIQNYYSGDEVSYQLIYDVPTSDGLTARVAVQAELVWEGGDWKLDPASGTELMSSDLYQGQPYIEWGPKS